MDWVLRMKDAMALTSRAKTEEQHSYQEEQIPLKAVNRKTNKQKTQLQRNALNLRLADLSETTHGKEIQT